MSKRSRDLVTAGHLPGILLATMAECERWIATGLVPVAERRAFRKGGRAAQALLFDAEVVASLATRVPDWRRQEQTELGGHRSRAPQHQNVAGSELRQSRPVDDAAHRRRQSILASVRKRTGLYVAEEVRRIGYGKEKAERVFTGYRAEFREPVAILPRSEPTEIVVDFAFTEPVEVTAAVLPPARVDRAQLAAAAQVLEARLLELRHLTFAACEQEVASWRDEFDVHLAAYADNAERDAIVSGIASSLGELEPIHASEKHGPAGAAREIRERLDDLRSKAAAGRIRHLREAQIREASGYERYAGIFPTARALGRKFLFLAGPTNSGKTYEALRLAGKASTAEILSPLRLLALEHYERMSAEGLAAGMVTGEERLLPDGVTHIARTIETLDLRRAVDVCVIDEIQMLADPNRGWAWTQAVIGAPAKLVVLTGAPEAIPIVEHLLAMTGEQLEIRILKRKGKLQVEGAPARLESLSRGDAVVAFSRKDVHDLRTRLVRAGRTVATVYGALGPEVRRAEAARYRNGEAEILVATDAIGMGLNIGPLRRVVFSTLRKFDGMRERQLSAMEIKQIAGRAGRFGHHDEGLVTALLDAGPYAGIETAISSALTGETAQLRGKAYVRPNQDTVLSASEVLQSDRLGRVLQHLNDTLVAGHPDLRMADMEEVIELAGLLDSVDLPILDRLSYSMAPVDGRERLAVELLLDWARQHARDQRVLQPNFGLNADLLKLEARVKVATTWLWLAQRYPQVYEDLEAVVDLRASLNARIEQQLIATSVSRRKKRDEKRRPDKSDDGRRQRRAACNVMSVASTLKTD
jgi:hypothetical protein